MGKSGFVTLIALVSAVAGTVALVATEKCYYEDGYNRKGYDRDGYDRDGYNRKGFDRNGYDHEGYDRDGYNAEGYNRNGFDKNGYDLEGYSTDGYNRSGFNRKQVDRTGTSLNEYRQTVQMLRSHWKNAHEQMNAYEYSTAIQNVRRIMEKALKIIVQHNLICDCAEFSTVKLLKLCEEHRLLDMEMINRLHDVRKICNRNAHDYVDFEHNTVYFVIMQVHDLLNQIERSF